MKYVKYLLTMLLVAIGASNVCAQDIITKRDGDEVEAKVLEILDTEIKYKKWSNLEGPTYTAKIADIFMIKYQNGEKDVFKEVGMQHDLAVPSSSQSQITFTDNQELIDRYNNYTVEYVGNDEDKKAKAVVCLLGIAPNSVLCNDDIEIEYETCLEHKNLSLDLLPYLHVIVKNKSENTIYLDLRKCFINQKCGNEPFKEDKQTITTSSSTQGVGVNIGAVGIGGGSGTQTTNIRQEEYYITIPPFSSASINAGYFDWRRTTDRRGKTIYEWRASYPFTSLYATMSENVLAFNLGTEHKRGHYSSYSYDNSPIKYSIVLNYSDKEDYSTAKNIGTTFYLKDVFAIETSRFGDITPQMLQSIKGLETARLGYLHWIQLTGYKIKEGEPLPR